MQELFKKQNGLDKYEQNESGELSVKNGMLKFQTNLPSNSKAPENSEENSSDYNNDSDSLISPPPSPEKVNQFTLNVNGNGKNDTPQNFSDDSNSSNDGNVQNEIAAEQNDENFEGVTNVEEEMNKQQEIDQENKRKLKIVGTWSNELYCEQNNKLKEVYDEQNNKLKKEKSIKENVWACILSGLGFAIAWAALIVVGAFELLPGVGAYLTFLALGVAAAAFVGINAINAFKIADKNMGNIKEQDKKGDREQKFPVKNICAAIFSGLGGIGVVGGLIAISILIFTEEILPLFAVALISFVVFACAMALLNVAFYNVEKAHEIIEMNSENAKKEKQKGQEQEQNKENGNEVEQNQETVPQQTTEKSSILPSNTGNGEPVPDQESVDNQNKEKND